MLDLPLFCGDPWLPDLTSTELQPGPDCSAECMRVIRNRHGEVVAVANTPQDAEEFAHRVNTHSRVIRTFTYVFDQCVDHLLGAFGTENDPKDIATLMHLIKTALRDASIKPERYTPPKEAPLA